MPSGPCALVELSVDSFWKTENSDATGTSLLAELSSDGQ